MPSGELLVHAPAEPDDEAAGWTAGAVSERAEQQRRFRRRRWGGLVVLAVLLFLTLAASLIYGARDIPFGTVVDALSNPVAGDADHSVVRDQRIPRTICGLVGGAAFGLVGALLQGLTRNPIADPSLMGINAGASFSVVLAIQTLGLSGTSGYVWFAFLGAGAAAALVYGAASLGWEGATPIKLALVGAATTAAGTAATTLVLLSDRRALEEFRFWQVGSLVGRDLAAIEGVIPFLIAGAVFALIAGRALNLLALGDDLARGLGQNVVVGRLIILVAVVLLSGAATSLVGPITFVGLVVPHISRVIVGPDYRWILPYCALLGGLLLVAADVLGRLIAQPGEVEAGLVVAFLGAPAMIYLIRRAKAVSV